MWRPKRDNVIVAVEAPPSQTAGGIVLPDYAKEQDPIGKVIAVGPDVKTVAVDSRVMFRSFAAYQVSSSGEKPELLLIPEKDILCDEVPGGATDAACRQP